MMSWNLRIVKSIDKKTRQVRYGIHEVFYTEDGRPWSMTDPVQIEGDSVEDVRAYLCQIQQDVKRLPVLDAQKTKWVREPLRLSGTFRLKSLQKKRGNQAARQRALRALAAMQLPVASSWPKMEREIVQGALGQRQRGQRPRKRRYS